MSGNSNKADNKIKQDMDQVKRDIHSNEVSYILRAIPIKLWKMAKKYCIDEDITLRELILQALEEKLKRGGCNAE